MLLRLMRLCHRDRYENMDYRYTALACTIMVRRCLAASNREDLMSIYAMPRMLITPFKPNDACTTPPSDFKLCAAKTTRSQQIPEGNPFADRWERINTVGSSPTVVRAQKFFWLNMDGGNAHSNQTFFGMFAWDGAVQCVLCLDGLYHHQANQEVIPLQDATCGDEPPNPNAQ